MNHKPHAVNNSREPSLWWVGALAVVWFFLLVLMAISGGCNLTPKPVVDPTPKLTTPLKTISAENHSVHTEHAAARSDLATAVKATSQPTVAAAVKSADAHVAAAETHSVNVDKATAVANTAAVEVGKDSVDFQEKNNALQGQINKLNSDFFSPRQKRDFWLFVIPLGLLALVSGILRAANVANPAVSVFQWILRVVFTGGLHLIEDVGHGIGVFINWIGAKLKPAAPAASTPAK